jgi:protocatechuate 3,4-dioxygenase beta subunit
MKIAERLFRPGAGETDGFRRRREALAKIGALGVAGLCGCGVSRAASGAAGGEGIGAAASSVASAPGSCILIPSETAGPFPLLAILSNASMVRKDVREGKIGIPMTLDMTLQNVGSACQPIANAAVYIWHCDKDGGYSGYSSAENGTHDGETYLRGIQVSDANGAVSFTTIFPGWYPGRITHIHFQIFLNNKLNVTATVTSQLTFPLDTIKAVYDTPLYRGRGQNTSVADYAGDGVFSDGATYQIAAVSDDPLQSLRATLAIGMTV